MIYGLYEGLSPVLHEKVKSKFSEVLILFFKRNLCGTYLNREAYTSR